jgi:mono/diheme cytochrome c family protein
MRPASEADEAETRGEMVKPWMRGLLLLGCLAAAVAVLPASHAGAGTGAQIDKGLKVYQEHCINCHGANLEGTSGRPSLMGRDFVTFYSDFEKLRHYIKTEMPRRNPGSLSHEQALDVTHYILSRNGVGPDGFAHPAFRRLWTAADGPVAALLPEARRSWLWGPVDGSCGVFWEPYAQAQGGLRVVQYFDKTRMEITNLAESSDRLVLTNGLLAKELVTNLEKRGDLPTDEIAILGRAPARIGVAGDQDDTTGPTYATFNRKELLDRVAESQAPITATIDRAGTVGRNEALGARARAAYFVPETGHNIANVFWDYLNASGPVDRDGQLVAGRLFDPWYAPVGFPLTEAYWARVKVAGQVQDVLVQVFERRVLTYTPENPEGFRVEMGNVGQHYFLWRYGRECGK